MHHPNFLLAKLTENLKRSDDLPTPEFPIITSLNKWSLTFKLLILFLDHIKTKFQLKFINNNICKIIN
jgi:hypothetical protein